MRNGYMIGSIESVTGSVVIFRASPGPFATVDDAVQSIMKAYPSIMEHVVYLADSGAMVEVRRNEPGGHLRMEALFKLVHVQIHDTK